MTPEQLTWTDKDWAIHMNCPVQEVPSIRTFITENFFPAVEHNEFTGKYSFVMTKMDTSYAGTQRIMQILSCTDTFPTFEAARTHANNEVISKLELTKFWASALHVPTRALQILHIEKQK